MIKALVVFSILALSVAVIGCGGTAKNTANSNSSATARVCEPVSDTPTEAYKRLFAAVKEKNAEKVKAEMSKSSQEFAQSLAARQNKTVEAVYENGFTATTFAPTLPEIRDERISGCYGGIEVRNMKDNKWEDLPFVIEDGMWKFGVGDLFSGAYKSPGKSRDTLEQEAANVSRGNTPPVNLMANANTNAANSNTKTSAPKYDGPQVEPLTKKK